MSESILIKTAESSSSLPDASEIATSVVWDGGLAVVNIVCASAAT